MKILVSLQCLVDVGGRDYPRVGTVGRSMAQSRARELACEALRRAGYEAPLNASSSVPADNYTGEELKGMGFGADGAS